MRVMCRQRPAVATENPTAQAIPGTARTATAPNDEQGLIGNGVAEALAAVLVVHRHPMTFLTSAANPSNRSSVMPTSDWTNTVHVSMVRVTR